MSQTGKQKKCPPGQRYDSRRGRCVNKSKGIQTLRAAPDFAIIVAEESAKSVMTRSGGSILTWGPRAGASPIPKEAHGKPCYLVSKAGSGALVVLGVCRPGILEARKTRITPLRKFPEVRAVKLAQGAMGPTVSRRQLIFLHEKEEPKKPEQKEQPQGGKMDLGKVLASSVGNPVADAGAHSHTLVRHEGRVFSQSRHFHKFVLPDGRVLVTDPDGDHPHGLDGDLATEEGSEHEHSVGLPPDMDQAVVKTKMGGRHTHPALTMATGFGGPHVHELEIQVDGKTETLVSMTAEEEAMEMPGGPGDRPDDAVTSPEAILEAAGSLGIKADGDIQRAIDEIMKQTAVQSVILSKERFRTADEAKSWAKENGFRDDKVDETTNSFRFRQFAPGRCKRGTFRNIRPRGTRGVQFVICVPRGAVTPPGLGGGEGGSDSTMTLGFDEDPLKKDVVEESAVRIMETSSGFTSFVQRDGAIFATDDKAVGKSKGKVVLLERQRMDGPSMENAPQGSKDGILVESVKGDPKKLAREHLGRRVFVMTQVGERLVEQSVHLGLLDPTKSEPCKI